MIQSTRRAPVGVPLFLLLCFALALPAQTERNQDYRSHPYRIGQREPPWNRITQTAVRTRDAAEREGAPSHPGERSYRYYPRSVFLYGGRWTDNQFGDLLIGRTEPDESYLVAAGVSRTVHEYNRNLLFETELNVTRHVEEQNHWAFNGALSARWMRFPWDRYVNSTFAFGLGPSYALERPEIEEEDDEDTARFLIYMMTELTFGPPGPRGSRWETFIRIHHRSGGFGLIKDSIGSNFITLGLRYRFKE